MCKKNTFTDLTINRNNNKSPGTKSDQFVVILVV